MSKKMELMSIYLCKRSDKHTPKRHFQAKKKNLWKFKKMSSFMPQATESKVVTEVK